MRLILWTKVIGMKKNNIHLDNDVTQSDVAFSETELVHENKISLWLFY